eukprot:COSAG02_NODE_2658_length_8313_cov_3.830411_8_plen_587_part_00
MFETETLIQTHRAAMSSSGAKPLPTAQGWAHGDTTTPVQEIFASASALSQRGEHALAAEGFGQVLRIMPNNAIARVNFATTIEKAGHPTLALTHFEQVIDAPDVDAQTKITARHRYGVLQLSETTYMCTEKDRSAERDSEQCVSEKAARLEKGVHYLQILLRDARADARADTDAIQAKQVATKLMTAEHRRLLARALVLLDRKQEAQAEYESLRSVAQSGSAASGWETALYTFEYGQLLETQGQASQAQGIYEEALAMNDPQAHARLCALENPLERTVLHCARILEILPEDLHTSVATRQVYTMLGKGYGLLGMLTEEQGLYSKGKELGVYRDTQQRCQFRVDVDLDETETEADLSAMHQQPVPDWRRFDVYRKAVALLEGAAADIKNEFLSVVGGAQALDSGISSGGFSLDVENLTSAGAWRQRTYMKDGQVITHAAGQGASFATTFPLTADVVERVLRLGELGGIGSEMPESSVEMSLLAPGTHLKRHCGPANHKWRLHLPLVVPVEAEAVRLRVSDTTLHWEEGKVLLFDDSFEHEVWNDAGTTRAVLIVDLWHPELDEDARAAVRKHFGTGAGTTAEQMQRA